ncbi:RNase P subunit p30, partial [Paraphysoderma sedebokerense]
NPFITSFDILSVTPTNDKLFQIACSTLDVDIISLDLSERLPFYIKRNLVGVAIERGIVFEICYSKAIRDPSARRNLISNAANLIRVTKGKNIILSSDAMKAMDVRGPFDVINLGVLFGLNQAQAKACISNNVRTILYHSG